MKNLKRTKNVFAGFVSLCLIACTQNYQDFNATLKEGVFGFEDANMSAEDINKLPYASTNVRIDDGAEVFIVLGLAEPSLKAPNHTQLKWVSSDFGMLVTENGRLIKTLRLPIDNLVGITPSKHLDPLSIQGEKPKAHYWQAKYDWQPEYRYGYTAEIQWRYMNDETIAATTWEKTTQYYQETVHFPSLNRTITNHFWLDKSTHRVVKSIQSIGPEMPEVAMTIVKHFNG
ncbi:YjbF family lipoprotein [Vibrio sp. JC009]|uniref:YjbF family lipoprotein n=1 Tax=Vibrio sp. JC009 TaxID=2912314 RepID=UPI0023B022AD|nr:YjbF family lipoprotein [Vibrio sp. JC009]WED24141.1 YjbF family lipoprotein [Vibrio sp. JC009]